MWGLWTNWMWLVMTTQASGRKIAEAVADANDDDAEAQRTMERLDVIHTLRKAEISVDKRKES